jgi:DNA segregation ATPase FtsK/SpoIIIE-like protein
MPPTLDRLLEAAELVITDQYASATTFRRKMRALPSDAVALIDQLEAAGVVGPTTDGYTRDVLITTDRLDQTLAEIRERAGASAPPPASAAERGRVLQLIVNHPTASTTLLERRLGMLAADAERVLDRFERIRVVGPADAAGERGVLMTPERLHQLLDAALSEMLENSR